MAPEIRYDYRAVVREENKIRIGRLAGLVEGLECQAEVDFISCVTESGKHSEPWRGTIIGVF